ncbi:gamma-glutamyltransferase [Chelatococcus sp. SYSU_G07232]|uniref:Glutathione hydrolase proenzyme n=2 Tax=Chelatococcus albus TaxID=3047466 RepID=A0ABT7AK54_9HYPH|nr:gamma-glutamyltransferase [Chelatococcus sp. SYSU_G07232]MDJ1159749.1 gamma-glutamyltransferase [Chelatococcus sp. SYSU_G07232]
MASRPPRLLTAILAAGLALAPLAVRAQGAPPGMPAGGQAILSDTARLLPVVARNGMVVSQEAEATRVGVDILRRGGNAVDAAVAVGFALAVTLPRAGNLGGGGFMLVHRAGKDGRPGETIAIDYRETAPAEATRDMFLDASGEPDPKKSRDSGLAVGVPGTVRGLALALEKYGSGKFTLADLVAPAERLAREGIAVEEDLADSLPHATGRLGRDPATAAIFLKEGRPFARGERLVQSDLAGTLAAIAARGPDAFYTGPIAEKIAASVKAAGGVMTAADLAAYRPVLRRPVTGRYRGYEVVSMPPPSSGGVHLVEILNILEGFDMKALGAGSADAMHLLAEAMKPAYADRAAWLGDPERVKVPAKGLTAKAYAETLRAAIDMRRARPAEEIRAGDPLPYESGQTTHFSVVDAEGNAVANTYTLNFSYGAAFVAAGTGVLLNNEMDDFAAKTGALNAHGLVGGETNSVAPGARPLSSMTPTFLFRDGRLALVTGSPGGSRIISTVLQVIVNVVDFDMNLAEAVTAPRLHHQWRPDTLLVETGFSPDALRLLRERGHKVVVGSTSGSASSILVTPEGLMGAADPRQRGTLAAGH